MEYMVEKFQCPGCANGSNTKCGYYDYNTRKQQCVAHTCGTYFGVNNPIALGMPKGFHKPGFHANGKAKNKIDLSLHKKGYDPEYDHLNVPVWAMEEDGFLFVRVFSPRINITWIDVIEGGSLDLCPNAIDVSSFIDEID